VYLPKIFLYLLVSPILAGALLAILSFDLGMDVRAQTNGTVTPTTTPDKRPKPTFFEEERRIRTPTPAEEREDKARRASSGFTVTFLEDAINGNQDPGALVGNSPTAKETRTPGDPAGSSPQVPQPNIPNNGIFQTAP
jgi:hypothetical protein